MSNLHIPLMKEEIAMQRIREVPLESLSRGKILEILQRTFEPADAEQLVDSDLISKCLSWDIETLTEDQLFNHGRNTMTFRQMRFSPMRFHCHDFMEMIYVAAGSCVNQFSSKALELHAGTICIIPPGCYHRLEVNHEEDIVYNILVRSSTFTAAFPDLIDANDFVSEVVLQSITDRTVSAPVHVSLSDGELASMCILDMERRSSDTGEGNSRICNNYFRLLSSIISDEIDSNPKALVPMVFHSKLDIISILQYIHTHYRDITIVSLADHFGYTPNYLSKIIKRDTGISFRKYLSNVRINRAIELMKNRDYEISSIMESVGISDLSYFYKAIKQHTGMTTVEYRKSVSGHSI